MCTVLVARRGTASRRLLASLLGCWIHVLMFRRAVLAVVSHAFTDGIERPQNQIFSLSRETRNELLALSCLGPVCMSDLRVGYAPFIFCTDASPDGAGICQSPESESVVQELWRHSEQRGYYTQLLTPAASVLSSLGESFEEFTFGRHSVRLHWVVPRRGQLVIGSRSRWFSRSWWLWCWWSQNAVWWLVGW